MFTALLVKLGLVAHAALATSTIGTVITAGTDAFGDIVSALLVTLLPYVLIIAAIVYVWNFFTKKIMGRKKIR